MNLPIYCILLFQTITFWDGSPPIHLYMKEYSYNCSNSIKHFDDLNYVSPEYGHEVITTGACLYDKTPVPGHLLLQDLSYILDFDNGTNVCHLMDDKTNE